MYSNDIIISIVVPTCDRKESLLRLLNSLSKSIYPIHEVLIIDSGTNLGPDELKIFDKLRMRYIRSERSVCIQRNLGIRHATAPWIFLCDDDLEVPAEYLFQLANHIKSNVNVGAVSGRVLQWENDKWDEQYPITSSGRLLWNYIFQLSMWGEIKSNSVNPIIAIVKRYYIRKGNHISKAGWPVVTDFSGEYFKTPIYGLGASLVKKEWLLNSPYDEVLDANGIGDNYGVAVGFPGEGIHVLKNAFVFHHRETINRPMDSNRYLKRILALHYFIKSRPALNHIWTIWFLWSLIGNLIPNILSRKKQIVRAILKSAFDIILGKNPYFLGAKNKQKVIEPTL
jgi:glycosyltransferase involved in cell wall biosynthesis